jgi:hypothetical protein
MAELTPNQLAILRLVHKARFADRDMVYACCSREPEAGRKQGLTPNAMKAVIRGLLKSQHLRGSKWYPKRRNPEGYGGRDKQILFLGKKGWDALGLKPTLMDERRINKIAPDPDRLRHQMMVSFWHALLLNGDRKDIFRRRMFHEGAKTGIAEEYSGGKLRVTPDARFLLDNGERRFWFVLEAETGEKSINHLLSKLRRYESAWKEELFAKAFEGMTDFFVVILVRTGRKMLQRLGAAEAENFGEQFRKRVLFVSQEDLDLENPEQLLRLTFHRLDVRAVPLLPRAAGLRLEAPAVSSASQSRESERPTGTGR